MSAVGLYSHRNPIISVLSHVGNAACAVTAKTYKVAKTLFSAAAYCITFPLRYFGSKTWSIPGVILRAPYLVCKRLFVRSHTPLIQELFPTHYRFSFEKTLSRDELKPYYPHVASTAFVHQTKEDFIPIGWKYLSPEVLSIDMPNVTKRDKCLIDLSSGFKASFIEKDNEVIVAFGSLEIDGGDPTTGKGKFSKGGNVIKILAGVTPKILTQADALVKVLRAHPYFQGKHITLTGNSYGATVAEYAGLKNSTPAVCFNAFALGVGLQNDIGSSLLRQADQYVTHISAEGDYVTDLSIYKPVDLLISAIGLKTPGNFGRRFRIPSAYVTTRSFRKRWLETHGFILGSVMQHLGHNKRAKPIELTTV